MIVLFCAIFRYTLQIYKIFIYYHTFYRKKTVRIAILAKYAYLCTELQAHADDGAGAPFVLIDDHIVVVEDRVVHHQRSAGEIAGREVIDDGSALVEDHVEAHMLRFPTLIVHGECVVVIDHEGWQHGEMQQPLPGEDEVVAVAASDADSSVVLMLPP